MAGLDPVIQRQSPSTSARQINTLEQILIAKVLTL
jgi:hypothetical protein